MSNSWCTFDLDKLNDVSKAMHILITSLGLETLRLALILFIFDDIVF